jgi:hypothetical protein
VGGKLEYYRSDEYADRYFGREYFGFTPGKDSEGRALEVIAMAYQALLGEDGKAKKWLNTMLRRDKELLALAIGALLRYRP